MNIWHELSEATEQLHVATTLPSITAAVTAAARHVAQADGATFILREGGQCFYADENSIAPLWRGRRFEMDDCISGWSMFKRTPVYIEDIYKDPRIPHDAYRPTFVKSLYMVPIRSESPLGAIGVYWSKKHHPHDEQIQILHVLANSAAIALENLDLKQKLVQAGLNPNGVRDREKELEATVYAMAHDLRNPLSTVNLLAQMVQASIPQSVDNRVNNLCETIRTTALRATDQINSLLALCSSASRKIEKQVVNLSEMAHEVAGHLRALHPGRSIHFEADSGVYGYCDPVLIRIVLDNLLGNAFKYTAKKPAAHIQFRRSSPPDTFLVRDNGEGFDNAMAGQLFRPLVRLHSDSDFRGTGLGLASVARIIELHGGAVRAEGLPQEGALFYFSLPGPDKSL